MSTYRRIVLVVSGVLLFGALPATASAADVFVSGGGVFVGDADDVGNVLTVAIAPGAPATAPTTVRVRDASVIPTLGPGPECVAVPGDANAVDCAVTALSVIVSAGPGDDIVDIAGPLSAEVYADAGDDAVRGSDVHDLLQGGPGNDLIDGRGGPDELYGNDGDDRLDGAQGADLVVGGNGKDTLEDTGADGAKDTVTYRTHATQGIRVTVGDGADDGENGGLEGDNVRAGFEVIHGSAFNDVLRGSAAAETLLGSDGDDDLDALGGADVLEGNAGNDVLHARDATADTRLECDAVSGSSQPAGTTDSIELDATGVDPDPSNCETVARTAAEGGGGGTPPSPSPLPSLRRLPTITGKVQSGGKLTCTPGEWTGSPTFSYAVVIAADPRAVPRVVSGTPTYTLVSADAGKLVSCVVAATNASGAVVGRSGQQAVALSVKLPGVRGLTVAAARERILDATKGKVDFGTAREQARDGRAKADIPCRLGGLEGTCSRGSVKAGRVYATTPKAGTVLAIVPGAGGALPRVHVSFYDAGKDERLPPVKTKKFGDDCPLRAGFSDADERAFVNSILGKTEAVAIATLGARECRFVTRSVTVAGQEGDPFVSEVEGTQIEGTRGARLTVRRPKRQDLAIVVFHRRLEGRDSFRGADLSRGPLNPGVGTDGQLTTLTGPQRNDVCFHVRESSTGRAVAGVEVRAIDPEGRPVASRFGTLETEGGSTDREGNRCDRWTVREQGTYRFSFVRRGDNGVNLEGALGLVAAPRDRKDFVTVSGRKVSCSTVSCEQTALSGVKARAAQSGGASALFEQIRSFIATLLGSSSGVDRSRAQAAVSGQGQPEVSLVRTSTTSGITPAFISNSGGTLRPSLTAPVAGTGAQQVADGRGGVISRDGAGITPASGGSAVALAASELIGQDGAGIVANDGATFVSGGAGKLIGQDGAGVLSDNGLGIVSDNGGGLVSDNGLGLITDKGAGIISGGAGNVVSIDGRALFVPASGLLPAGTLVSGGAGNAIPVSAAR